MYNPDAPHFSLVLLLLLHPSLGTLVCTRDMERGLKREQLGPKLTPNSECHVGEGFVSVVVPAYNEGDGVKLTLANIDEMAQVRYARLASPCPPQITTLRGADSTAVKPTQSFAHLFMYPALSHTPLCT